MQHMAPNFRKAAAVCAAARTAGALSAAVQRLWQQWQQPGGGCSSKAILSHGMLMGQQVQLLQMLGVLAAL